MGYTHYWTIKENSDEKFAEFAKQVKQITDHAAKKIDLYIRDMDETAVLFNGLGAESHEDFYVTRNSSGFNFCKTNEKPYDFVVVACLTAMKRVYGDSVEVSSDGNWQDWNEGVTFYQEVALAAVLS